MAVILQVTFYMHCLLMEYINFDWQATESHKQWISSYPMVICIQKSDWVHNYYQHRPSYFILRFQLNSFLWSRIGQWCESLLASFASLIYATRPRLVNDGKRNSQSSGQWHDKWKRTRIDFTVITFPEAATGVHVISDVSLASQVQYKCIYNNFNRNHVFLQSFVHIPIACV